MVNSSLAKAVCNQSTVQRNSWFQMALKQVCYICFYIFLTSFIKLCSFDRLSVVVY